MEANSTDLRPSHKRKRSVTSPSFCFSCCFRKLNNKSKSTNIDGNDGARENHTLTRSSSTWLKSRISDFPDIQNRYKNIVSKLGRHTVRHRRRHASDFSYDAFSYALNFDDGITRADDYIHPRCFSARLPTMTDSDVAAAEDNVDSDIPSPTPIGEVSAFKFRLSD